MVIEKLNLEKKSFYQRRWVWISAIGVIAIAVFLAISPYLLKRALEQMFLGEIADEVSIENIEIDYMDGLVTVSNVDLHKGGKSVLKLSTLRIKAQLTSLLRAEINLNEVMTENTSINLYEDKSGKLRLGKLVILDNGNKSEPATKGIAERSAKLETKSERNRGIEINSIIATNSRINVNSAGLDTTFLINRIKLNKFADLQIDQIEVQDLNWRIANIGDQKNPDTATNLSSQLDNGGSVESNSKFNIKINGIQSSGQNTIHILAQSLDPAIEFSLNVEFAVGKVDSSRPNLSTPFTFTGVDQTLELVFDGSAKLFSTTPQVDVAGDIKGISLPDINQLISQKLGFNVETGEMEGLLNLHIGKKLVQGNLTLTIKHLSTTTADREKLVALEENLPVTLKKAVRLLRRKDGTIQVTIPIKGGVSGLDFKLKFDLSNALNRGLEGVGRAYIFLLEPVLTPLVQHLIKKSRDLKPIYFETASINPNVQGNKHIKKIGNYLTRNSTYSVAACGWAVPLDRVEPSALRPAEDNKRLDLKLLKLARNRADRVKQILNENFNIETNRLITCRPVVEFKGMTTVGIEGDGYKIHEKVRGKPRVDIFRYK